MQPSIHLMYFAKSTMCIFGFALSVVFSFVCVFECMSLHIFYAAFDAFEVMYLILVLVSNEYFDEFVLVLAVAFSLLVIVFVFAFSFV